MKDADTCICGHPKKSHDSITRLCKYRTCSCVGFFSYAYFLELMKKIKKTDWAEDIKGIINGSN